MITRTTISDGATTDEAISDGATTDVSDGAAPDRATAEGATPFALRPFRAASWAPGPHLQTLAGKLLRPAPPLDLERERWETPDGDFLDLDFAPEPAPRASASPLVLVLHGLEGSSRRRYALLAYHELARHGIRAVGLNFRSCSGEPNRTARAYHSGETEDLAFALGALRARFPDRPMGAMGFSLGGNVLLKFLGERGGDAPLALQASAAISVPYDLSAGALSLESSRMGRFYAAWFLRSLRRKARRKTALLEGRVRLDEVWTAATIREFDDLLTAPLHGFRSAAHYYQESSSAGYLERIRVPTLLLHALDDPFLPRSAVPFQPVRANPALVPGFVEHGGHVGFVEGSPTAPRFWAEAEAARFLALALGRS